MLKLQLLEGTKKIVLDALKPEHWDIDDAIHYIIAVDNEMNAIVTLDMSNYLPSIC